MKQHFLEQYIINESRIKIKVFQEDDLINITLGKDEIELYGRNINNSNFIVIKDKGELLIPKDSLEKLRIELPNKEKI